MTCPMVVTTFSTVIQPLMVDRVGRGTAMSWRGQGEMKNGNLLSFEGPVRASDAGTWLLLHVATCYAYFDTKVA